jgi:probable phosphoglycerate mutase
MDVILIRHGQSEANKRRLLIADRHDGLTVAGREQSKSVADVLVQEEFRPDFVYSSPWKRAAETAKIIFSDRNIIFDERLAETNPGVYGTWLEDDFNTAYPEFHQNIANTYQGGESHLDMANRVCEWVESEIMENASQEGLLAAVAHGGPISVILQSLLSIPIRTHYPSFSVPNASYTHLVWRKDKQRYFLITAGK